MKKLVSIILACALLVSAFVIYLTGVGEWNGYSWRIMVKLIECNSEYKEALQLVNRNTERLKDTLTKEQLDLLLRYSESRNELSNITELDAFKSGFKLGAGLVMETIK